MSDVDDLVRRLGGLAKKKKDTYFLGSKMSLAAVEKFEDQSGITLPDEYRAFLLAAGEGASGPEYGLVTLEDALKQRGESIYDLADPFPAPLSTTDHLDFSVGGILPVCYGGCSYYTGIVTTGPDRGQMWFSVEDRPGWVPICDGEIVDQSGAPFRRIGDDYRGVYDVALLDVNRRRRVGFAAWYASWLEEEERAFGGGAS